MQWVDHLHMLLYVSTSSLAFCAHLSRIITARGTCPAEALRDRGLQEEPTRDWYKLTQLNRHAMSGGVGGRFGTHGYRDPLQDATTGSGTHLLQRCWASMHSSQHKSRWVISLTQFIRDISITGLLASTPKARVIVLNVFEKVIAFYPDELSGAQVRR